MSLGSGLLEQHETGELQLAVFLGDDVAIHALPRGGSVSIGRAEGNDIRIDNPSVSRKHCVLHLGPPLRVQDLGGANGTFVRDPTRPAESNDTQDLRQLSGQTIDVALGECVNLGTTMIVIRRAPAERGRAPTSQSSTTTSSGSAFVVRDPAMTALYEQAFRAAQSPISILILGETGVGKEVLAQEIHRRSPRARGPFLGLNCAALSESLLESELFGHEKGSFTGAVQARPGLFESAEGGTVFLDEVGELPISIQVKLLRVLEAREVLRVGSRTPRAVDVRFIAATNRDLEDAVTREAFRQDLYFRLNGIALTIPPLRERTAEIEPLAALFVSNACRQLDRNRVPTLPSDVLTVLRHYRWPGNVRELRNVMDRAMVLCIGDSILPEHLPPKLTSASMSRPSREPESPATERVLDGVPPPARMDGPAEGGEAAMEKLRREMETLERQRIVEALERCAGNQTQAAELLGMSRRTLVTRLGDYGIARPRKRS